MLVASHQRFLPVRGGIAWHGNASMFDGLRGAAGRTPPGLSARAGAPMENGTAGWGDSPPPQPTGASPSEGWSKAWAENFPGTLTHAGGELLPLPPLPTAPPLEAAPMPDWPPPPFPASEPAGHPPAPAAHSLAVNPAPPQLPAPPTAPGPPAAPTPPVTSDPPWVPIPPAAPAFPGPGPRVAVSHRQQRGRKPPRTGPRTPRPDDTEPSSPRGRGRATAFLCAVLAVQAALSLWLVWSNTASQDEATS